MIINRYTCMQNSLCPSSKMDEDIVEISVHVRIFGCYGQVEKTKRYETNKRTTLKLKFSKKMET